MDSATLVTIIWTMIGAIAAAGLALIAWGLKVLIVAVFDNTVQIKLLNQNLDKMAHLPIEFEKLKRDVHVAHERIRDLQTSGG